MKVGRGLAPIVKSCCMTCAALLLVASTGFAYTPTPTFGNTPTATPTSNGPPVPIVEVGPNPAASGDTVILDASASRGAITSYQWSGPPEIVIEDASSPVASFVAPEVEERVVVTIELDVTGIGDTPANFARIPVDILPRDTVEVIVGNVWGVPGAAVPVGVTFRSTGQAVVSVGNEIEFERFAFIRSTEAGLPDCQVNPELPVESATFDFLPDGCAPGVDCVAVSAQVTTATPIPEDSIVYECQVFLSMEPIEPTDTCRHELPCQGTGAQSAAQEPLDVICVEGSATASSGVAGLSFDIAVDPPAPRVGDLVHIRITATGTGGRRIYQLHGTAPFLEGDVSQRAGLGMIEYELQATCPGTAKLRTVVSYEVEDGCPGSEVVYHRTGDSEEFEIEILPATTYTISGTVAEFPSGCFGAQRGATVTLQPLGLTTQTSLADGSFAFDNVPAGEYTLAVGPSCNPFGCWPPEMLTVTDSDVDVRLCPATGTPPVEDECPGDCDHDGTVTINEVIAAVGSSVGGETPSCGTDVDANGKVDISELVLIIRAALTGC